MNLKKEAEAYEYQQIVTMLAIKFLQDILPEIFDTVKSELESSQANPDYELSYKITNAHDFGETMEGWADNTDLTNLGASRWASIGQTYFPNELKKLISLTS